jgi:hypothetical protein
LVDKRFEAFEAALTRKLNPRSAPRRIFDGVAEAKLIARTCGPAPVGYARSSLSLLEKKFVELNISEKASDNAVGRTLKEHPRATSQAATGDCAERRFRRQYGRLTEGLSTAACSAATRGLSRPNHQVNDRRNTRADATSPTRPRHCSGD